MLTEILILIILYFIFLWSVAWVKYFNNLDKRFGNSVWRWSYDYPVKVKRDISFLDDKNFKNKNLSEKKLLSVLRINNIDMICLAGFMKILSGNFIKKFKGKILNIHPSLLPKYKGLNTHGRVLNNKEKYSGCTVHFVNSRLDSGKIILQKKIKISKNETKASLAKKILAQEHKLYPKAISKIFNL